MIQKTIIAALFAVAALAAAPVKVDLKDAMGKPVGTAMISEAKTGGVVIHMKLMGLPPGEHAAHIHTNAKCEGPAFTSAGAPAHLSGQTATPAATSALGPRLAFVTNEYHFGKVAAGELVKYVFIATNTGDQTLVISNVAPGCHCTTAGDWTHRIEPGKSGKIPIQFDSGAFRGDVTKNITVTSNDKLQPIQTLTLRGTIWRPIDIRPQFAYINIMPDASNATTIVHIVNQTDDPITLSNLASANASFKGELTTMTPGKEFDLTITALPPFKSGSTSGSISIRTSMTNMPVIAIATLAVLQPAVNLVPMQLVLPSPVTQWTTNFITITANGRKALALSNPEASDKRVSVAIKAITPGRVFQLTAIFPPGFQLAPLQTAQVSVQSNNEERPAIIVPIIQAQPPPAASLPSRQAAGHP